MFYITVIVLGILSEKKEKQERERKTITATVHLGNSNAKNEVDKMSELLGGYSGVQAARCNWIAPLLFRKWGVGLWKEGIGPLLASPLSRSVGGA